jgi:hypothetical protein
MGIVSLFNGNLYNSLGNDINIVGTFSRDSNSNVTEKHVSPPLLNYVEPYQYGIGQKTMFYTEVNTNIKEGDRVFILNGNYDSSLLISSDKYKKGRDGYKVLYVDRCAIVLDIDFTGVLPYNGGDSYSLSDYVKIFNISSYDAFITANKQLTSRGGYIGNKFDLYQNNIAYITTDFFPIDDGWVKTTGVTASPGFYVRRESNGVGTWENITNQILSGSFSIANSEMNPAYRWRHYNNGKFIVMGDSLNVVTRVRRNQDAVFNTYTEYKSGSVYKWEESTKSWKVDVTDQGKFTGALITKANFRGGDFYGSFNSGVYGSKDEKIRWTGDGEWNGGTFYNSSWARGSMKSLISLPESYTANITRNGLPYQKANTFNNGGYGFNYVIESEFESTSIYASIVRNTKFGISPTIPVVERHIKGETQSFDRILTDGLFESCEFNNTLISGGAVKRSRIYGSKVSGTKVINSQSSDVVLEKSTLIFDSIIKIDGYDEWITSERKKSNGYSNGIDFKVFKFYIGEGDFLNLKQGDSFYIRGLSVKEDDNILNFFDRKFTIGSWVDYSDALYEGDVDLNLFGNLIEKGSFYKKGIRCAAFLSYLEENEWVYSSVKYNDGYKTVSIKENENPRYSVDIFVSLTDIYGENNTHLNFNNPTQSVSADDLIMPDPIGDRIDITNAYIVDSNIESGIVDDCDWNGGYFYGYNNDLIISNPNRTESRGKYNISFDQTTSTLAAATIQISNEIEIPDRKSNLPISDIKEGDVLFANAIDYYTYGKILSISILDVGSGYGNNDAISPVMVTQSGTASGYDFVISFTANGSNEVDVITIDNPGYDYSVGDTFKISLPNQGSELTGGRDAVIMVSEVSTLDTIRFPDSYKVDSFGGSSINLIPLGSTSSTIGMTAGGKYITVGAENRWNGLSRLKISNSRIKSGIIKRGYFNGCEIGNEDYDSSDIDFTNMEKIRGLVLAETIFSDGGNVLSSATYYNSFLLGGSDVWYDGIAYESILNGIDFSTGTVKKSNWIDGTFNGGMFYNSNSYNATPTSQYPFYYNDRVLSHYKSGKTWDGKNIIANNRYSWKGGTFNGGEFYVSDWEGGIFEDGNFYKSRWYDGVANGGKFGNDSTATEETAVYGGEINYAVVDNATFVADDIAYSATSSSATSSLVWNDGIFNKGTFGSRKNVIYNTKIEYTQTPYKTVTTQLSVSNTATIQISTTSTEKDIRDIQLNLFLNLNQTPNVNGFLSDIIIDLVAPNGKKLIVKNYDTTSGGVIVDALFTGKRGTKLISGTPRYQGVFTFEYGGDASVYSKSIDDLIDSTDGIKGDWKINIRTRSVPLNSGGSLGIEATANLTWAVGKAEPIGTIQNSAVWNDGIFNGGEFIDNGVWKNGTFNGGKFISSYGWEVSGSYSVSGPKDSFTWQGGVFNNGDFGNSSKGANSTWFTGDFNGGNFTGRVWEFGVFKNGTFNGSGKSPVGGWSFATFSNVSNANSFVQSFTNSFYGLWKNGIVTDRNDLFSVDKKLSQKPEKPSDNTTYTSPLLDGVLWRRGTFDHRRGTIQNSVWIGGNFENGTFKSGSFNPYVQKGSFMGNSIYKFEDDTNCIWNNGRFEDGDFWYSTWKSGDFISGTAVGMYFMGGTSYYMNAYNVLWDDRNSEKRAVWKNGNWNGSTFDYSGSIDNPMIVSILDKNFSRNASFGTQNKPFHIWNVFLNDQTIPAPKDSFDATDITTYAGGQAKPTTKDPFYPPVQI